MSAPSHQSLLLLQASIKKDPQGYRDEFLLQYRHYTQLLKLFKMAPAEPASHEFTSLVQFMSHVQEHYADAVDGSYVSGIVDILKSHGALLHPSTRTHLVKALILIRNKSLITAEDLLPTLFTLFPIQDKTMRTLMSRHIAADIKSQNKKGQNEQFNRRIQNMLLNIVEQDDEVCAKRALVVFTDMWRRQVWRDARTANAIAAAVFHKSDAVGMSGVKFFLGQDEDGGEGDSDVDDDEDDINDFQNVQPSKEQMYKAFHKGTAASKKKKQKKLKRAMDAVKKKGRREARSQQETFAAIQLLHDPQGFAEKLFKQKLKKAGAEARTQLLLLISRVIGVHSLMVLNFYPFLQKYITPSRKDVTQLLAALVQACHDQVPPDALQPVLRQLVDQFVHDRARPEVITVGIKTVREMCLRAPLVMNEELLVELSEYKKHRDKEVATTARSLISLFRELDASMLKKKDRGREGVVGQRYELLEIRNHVRFRLNFQWVNAARHFMPIYAHTNTLTETDLSTPMHVRTIAAYGAQTLATEDDVVGDRILTDEDFKRLREEKMEEMMEEQMSIHGLQSLKQIQETRVDPTSLLGKKRGRADKAERLASVMEGREGRMEFGAKAKLKKDKTGGLSNKEKERRKRVLVGGVSGQVARRMGKKGRKGGKQFKGRVKQ